MGTDKTDPVKQEIQIPFLSVLVVKSVVKILQNPVRPCPLHSHCGQNSSKTPNPALIPARSVPPIKVILGRDGNSFLEFTEESPTRITESFSFRVTE
jgi:hypothetical protein